MITLELVDRSHLAIAIFACLLASPAHRAEAASRKSPGSDHVVSACPADPYEGASALYVKGQFTPDAVFGRLANALTLEAKTVYVVHVTEWEGPTVTPAASGSIPFTQRLVQSTWAAYDNNGKAKALKFDANGNPVIFNATSTRLLGVTHFSNDVLPSTITVGYAFSTTPSQKQNVTDVVALIQALAGTPANKQGKTPARAATTTTFNDTYLTDCEIKQDSHLPLSINLSYTVTPKSQPGPVTAAPASLDFGNQAINGQTAAKTVTVTNNVSTLTLTNNTSTATTFQPIKITGPNTADFKVAVEHCTPKLAAQNSCTIDVVFAPQATGQSNATLSIADDAANSPQTVSLTGMGVASAAQNSPAAGKGPGGSGGKPKPSAPAAAPGASSPSGQTQGGNTPPAASGPSPVDCTSVTSDAPCTISRTIADNDREYWDVGLGLSMPGVRERNYNAARPHGQAHHHYAYRSLRFSGHLSGRKSKLQPAARDGGSAGGGNTFSPAFLRAGVAGD